VNANELRLYRKDGEELWAKISTTPIPGEQRGADGQLVMLTDITESKHAEELVRKSSSELQAVLDHSPALIYMKDQAGRYIFVNRCWTELFKIPSERAKGKTDFEKTHEACGRSLEEAAWLAGMETSEWAAIRWCWTMPPSSETAARARVFARLQRAIASPLRLFNACCARTPQQYKSTLHDRTPSGPACLPRRHRGPRILIFMHPANAVTIGV
jgi:PAS domain-containing protein